METIEEQSKSSDDNDMENSIHLEPNQTIENRGDKSYLIVWHVSQR